jgi:hypothetical protein
MRLGEEQGEAVEQTVGIALEEAREDGVERAIGERSVNQEQPAILCNETMGKRGNVIVSDVVRSFFEGVENRFEAGEIAASNRDASEIFEEGGEQRGSFWSGFFLEGF